MEYMHDVLSNSASSWISVLPHRVAKSLTSFPTWLAIYYWCAYALHLADWFTGRFDRCVDDYGATDFLVTFHFDCHGWPLLLFLILHVTFDPKLVSPT